MVHWIWQETSGSGLPIDSMKIITKDHFMKTPQDQHQVTFGLCVVAPGSTSKISLGLRCASWSLPAARVLMGFGVLVPQAHFESYLLYDVRLFYGLAIIEMYAVGRWIDHKDVLFPNRLKLWDVLQYFG